MARYSRIDRRMWGDEAFRQLSKPQPNAQTLFVFLLTGPQVTNIPGIFSAGEAALAEMLGWPLKAFREAFQELLRKPLVKADWEARLVFIPNAIKYNPPVAPNVVKSWCASWDEIPECSLKGEAFQLLKSFLEGMGKAFAEAFQEACGKPSPKPLAIQDQEQEQKQESPLPPKGVSWSHSLNGHESSFEIFWRAYPKKRGKGPAEKAWAKIKPDDMLLGTMLAKIDQAKQTSQWTKDRGEFIPHPATWLNAKGWEDEYETPGTLNTKPPADACTWRLDSNGRRSRTCGEPIAANQPHPIRPFCPQHLAERQRLDAKLQEANA